MQSVAPEGFPAQSNTSLGWSQMTVARSNLFPHPLLYQLHLRNRRKKGSPCQGQCEESHTIRLALHKRWLECHFRDGSLCPGWQLIRHFHAVPVQQWPRHSDSNIPRRNRGQHDAPLDGIKRIHVILQIPDASPRQLHSEPTPPLLSRCARLLVPPCSYSRTPKVLQSNLDAAVALKAERRLGTRASKSRLLHSAARMRSSGTRSYPCRERRGSAQVRRHQER